MSTWKEWEVKIKSIGKTRVNSRKRALQLFQEAERAGVHVKLHHNTTSARIFDDRAQS